MSERLRPEPGAGGIARDGGDYLTAPHEVASRNGVEDEPVGRRDASLGADGEAKDDCRDVGADTTGE